MNDTITDPCEQGDALGRHRWARDQPTHFIAEDGQAVLDDWCCRCGQWRTDVVHPKGGYPPLPYAGKNRLIEVSIVKDPPVPGWEIKK